MIVILQDKRNLVSLGTHRPILLCTLRVGPYVSNGLKLWLLKPINLLVNLNIYFIL